MVELSFPKLDLLEFSMELEIDEIFGFIFGAVVLSYSKLVVVSSKVGLDSIACDNFIGLKAVLGTFSVEIGGTVVFGRLLVLKLVFLKFSVDVDRDFFDSVDVSDRIFNFVKISVELKVIGNFVDSVELLNRRFVFVEISAL